LLREEFETPNNSCFGPFFLRHGNLASHQSQFNLAEGRAVTYSEDSTRACASPIAYNTNILHWEEWSIGNSDWEWLALVTKPLAECILLTIHRSLDWWFKPIEGTGEIRTGITVSPVDWVIEKEATLRNAIVSDRLRDFACKGIVSCFRVEAGLWNGTSFGSGKEAMKIVGDANVSPTIVCL
jgi:hypothetical protein